jgi:hypothetical protein
MRGAANDGPRGGDERLGYDEAAEYALPADPRADAAKDILLDFFKVEEAEKLRHGRRGSGCFLTVVRVASRRPVRHDERRGWRMIFARRRIGGAVMPGEEKMRLMIAPFS